MDTKAAFEKWWKDEYSHLESSKYTDLVPHIKYGFFQAWQASRAAIEIELEPLSEQYFASDIKNSFEHGRETERKATIQVLTSHGIRIKGKTE